METSKLSWKGVLLVLISGLLVIALITNRSLNSRLQDQTTKANFTEAKYDSLKVITDKKTGEITYQKKVYEATEAELKSKLKDYDKELAALQKKYKNATTVNKTSIEYVDKEVLRIDSVVIPVDGREIRYASDSTEFNSINIVSYPDSMRYDYKARAAITLINQDGVLIASSDNPKLKITDLKGYNTVPKKKKKTFWTEIASFALGFFIATKL